MNLQPTFMVGLPNSRKQFLVFLSIRSILTYKSIKKIIKYDSGFHINYNIHY